jgi:hypothetical protein
MILNSTYAAAENISSRLPGLISVLTVKSLKRDKMRNKHISLCALE